MKSYSDLCGIVAAGWCVIFNASSYSYSDLRGIAAAGVDTGGKLIVKSANSKSYSDCRGIAAANPGNVTFDFSE